MINSIQYKKTRKSGVGIAINEKIIKVLETVKSYYARERNTIHVNAYERAIYQIRKWPHPIKKGKDVAHLEGIGKGMVGKIDTILATGTLPIIQEKGLTIQIQNSKTKKSFSMSSSPISRVLGFSERRAEVLEKQYSVRSVSELETLVSQGKIKLTKMQAIGLRYHKDLQEKVPRAEITQIGYRFEDILSRGKDGIMVFLAGSYSSGLKKESKDIDILLVVRDSSILKSRDYLEELVNKLKTELPLETITLGANKFLGVIKLPDAHSRWRHLDMRLVDIHSFPYAWLYYASGVIFNKMIREKLKKRGYKLNEWGLFHDDSRVFLYSEKSILDLEKEFNELQEGKSQEGKSKGEISQENNKSNKEHLLNYTEKIEKEIFKLAQLDYKTIRERY